jgi:hypothetical protein
MTKGYLIIHELFCENTTLIPYKREGVLHSAKSLSSILEISLNMFNSVLWSWKKMLEFLIDDISVVVDAQVFQKSTGIPMGKKSSFDKYSF